MSSSSSTPTPWSRPTGEEKPLHTQCPKHALELLPLTGCVAVCVHLCSKDHPETASQTLATDTLRQPFSAHCAKHNDYTDTLHVITFISAFVYL